MQLGFTEIGSGESEMPAMAPFAMRSEGIVYNRGTTRGSGVLESGHAPPVAREPQRAEQREPPRQEPPRLEPPPRMDPPRLEPPRLEPPRLEPPRLEPPRLEQRPQVAFSACPVCTPSSCPPQAQCPACPQPAPCPPCPVAERAPIWLMYALLLANLVTLVMCIIMVTRKR
jgi:hypothetical protein